MSQPSGLSAAGKAVILTLAAVCLATLALWASGALFFLMHRAIPYGVRPWTWLLYVHFYWHDPRQRQLLLLSAVVCVAVAIWPFAVLADAFSEGPRALHGAARFATASETKSAGLFGDQGIIVGKLGKRFLHFPGQQFVLLAAPTRSGKGVSFVVPNLLNWPDSCVVLDIKLENFQLTSKFRARHGQKVFLFNPYAEDGRTHRWNPLDGISRDAHQRVGDLLSLAAALYPAHPGDRDAIWADTARNLFLGLALMVMESPELPFTMGEILRQSSGKGRSLKDYINERIEARANAVTPYSEPCLDALNRFLSATENTLSSIVVSFTAPLVAFANPRVDAATAQSDFDIAKVRLERMTLYIGIQPNRLADASMVLNLLFSQLIHLNTQKIAGEGVKHQCLLILDEFPALGKIAVLATANAFIAGYGLRLLTVVQSIAQLESVYGVKDARTLMTNHAMQVLFTPREQSDANLYSEMLGYYTVKATSKGRSSNRGFGAGGSTSENISDQRRALMLPQELREMSEDDQIIILENARPIRCRKARFHSEKAFMARLMPLSPSLRLRKGLPSRRELEAAAFTARELSIEVPQLDLVAHRTGLAAPSRPLRAEDPVDLSVLDIDIEALPTFSEPENPSDEEVARFVDAFFALGAPAGDLAELSGGDETIDSGP